MLSYHHLSLEEREKLYALREQGYSFRQIGNLLGRNHTVLSREYRRHAKYGKTYIPCKAHLKAVMAAKEQRTKAPLKNHLIFLYVRQRLRGGWSPEEIAGRLPLDYPGKSIHPETIYRYIYNQRKTRGMKLWRYLKLHRKRRLKADGRKVKSQGKIPYAVRIDLRPAEVNLRQSAGHWETDNMEGKRSDRTTASVEVERKTRYALVSKLKDRLAQTKTDCIVNNLSIFPSGITRTLTADNGHENTFHRQISQKLNLSVFFCHAYHGWEKGTVENTIGRIRKYLPKGTSLDRISERKLKMIEYQLSHTPRKCLNYLTPYEKMQEELAQLKIKSGALQVRM